MNTTIERTTVRLPATLLNQARKVASERHLTLTELIESGLRLELKALEQAQPSPPEIPVCAASLRSPGLPPETAKWSAGAWETWADSNPE